MTAEELHRLIAGGESASFEAKSAKGGIPDSLWETYSAFANTEGGIIALGIKELANHKLVVEGLPDAAKAKADFWNLVNNRQKVNANILTDRKVHIDSIDGKDVLVIEVPRADRMSRPIYKGSDPISGSFRRNGDGDYLCTREQVAAMFRDADVSTQDKKVIESKDMTAFSKDTIRSYRNIFRYTHINHVWNDEEDEIFLRKIGAMAIGKDGKYHPTAAGLLMFGYEYEITDEFPHYFLDYQENRQMGTTRWADRIVSSSGDWSGNVFDFVWKISSRLTSDLKVPFVLRGFQRIDDTPLHHILREAITNAVAHADFYGRRGVVIRKNVDGFEFSNPGCLRVSLSDVLGGGVSDPRNDTLLKMFTLIKFGERAGSGLNGILKVWERVFHTPASVSYLIEDVDRTKLSLPTGGNEQDVKAMLELYDHADELTFDADEQEWKKMMQEMKGKLKDISGTNEPQNGTINGTCGTENDTNEPQNGTINGIDDPQSDTINGTKKDLMALKDDGCNNILMLIRKDKNVTLDAMSQSLNIARRTVTRRVKQLQEQGILSYIGSKKTGYWQINDIKTENK